jgi:hypothetical protein
VFARRFTIDFTYNTRVESLFALSAPFLDRLVYDLLITKRCSSPWIYPKISLSYLITVLSFNRCTHPRRGGILKSRERRKEREREKKRKTYVEDYWNHQIRPISANAFRASSGCTSSDSSTSVADVLDSIFPNLRFPP